MSEKIKKTVGVMGGMGPLATADLIANIVAHTKAERDSDHVHLLIDCDGSVPDRTEAILHGGESPLVKLTTMAKNLEFMGVKVDESINAKAFRTSDEFDVSASDAKVRLLVIPTNEELMIARDTYELVK